MIDVNDHQLLRDQMIPDSHLLHNMNDTLGALRRLIFQKLIEGMG